LYLSSAELAAVGALLGRIPTTEEYMAAVGGLAGKTAEVYRYMNFDQIPEFVEVAETVKA
jgi:aconitate hydratase 2/2-methylisocitrate dehydratase